MRAPPAARAAPAAPVDLARAAGAAAGMTVRVLSSPRGIPGKQDF